MDSQYTLIRIGKYNLSINHLFIIGILSLSFTTSFLLRSLPSDYGWELNEFDPFFNYRATEFIVQNGIESYFNWNDELSWYPIGRDISSNSQVMLHMTAAITYWIFGSGSSVYDYTIIFPVIVGSLTSIVLFALVRVIAGTNAGLLSALLFSVSIPILIRGQIGWFKSEPLGLFFGILAVYLLLSGLQNSKFKTDILKFIFSGLVMSLALSSWGGNLFFLIPIAVLIISLPFVNKNHKFILTTIPFFTASLVGSSFLFERLGSSFVSGLSGLSIIIPTVLMISLIYIQKLSDDDHKNRNSLIFVFVISIIFILLLTLNENLDLIDLPTHRYLNAIYPLFTTTDPLTDSVSEHATLYITQSFQFHSVLMIFAGIGVWLLFKKNEYDYKVNNGMKIFVLSIGMLGVYIGSAFMRLEVFTSISIILLASIGITMLFNFVKISNLKKKIVSKKNFYILGFGFFIFLMIPLFLPVSSNVLALGSSIPPTIMNGGTNFDLATNDWRGTLEWLKKNTDNNSVIGSWWDYGYWIQTIAQRPSLADNSTLIDHRIETIAKIFFSSPQESWNELKELETDYFVVFVAGERLPYTTENGDNFYILGGGADESKKFWIAKIAGVKITDFIHSDNFSGTELFWDDTFFGKSIPFELQGYVNFSTDELSQDYVQNWDGVYTFKNKFENSDYPFRLIYQSDSMNDNTPGKFLGIFVYELLDP